MKPINLQDKLKLLSADAEQDVCSPHTVLVRGSPTFTPLENPAKDQPFLTGFTQKRGNHLRGNHLKCLPGIYPALLPNGKVINLFKILLTNRCELNCLYCANRKNREIIREKFSPDELARTFMQYFSQGYVEGLFLSSAIENSPLQTMDKMLATCFILRKKYQYPGYIHLKVLPGSTTDQMEKAVELANRVSLNLEAPSKEKLKKLSPQKMSFSLLENLKTLSNIAKKFTRPVSVSTQMVIGPAGETDKEIIRLTEELHQQYNLRRVYFSAFVPIPQTPLENFPPTPLLREHRLYQVDWLIHFYGFKAKDFEVITSFEKNGNLPLEKDPKLACAEAEQGKTFFPVEINNADYYQLLRIPGIGPVSAKKILEYRRENKIHNLAELKNLGVVTKRAEKFILLCGKTPPLRTNETCSEKLLLPLNL